MSPGILLLSLLPKNLISYLTGVLVRLSFPKSIGIFLNRSFVKLFKIDMSEAEYPLTHYKTIEDVFTRRLKKEARPVSNSGYCSPCDGVLSLSESLKPGENFALQAKGFRYEVSELVFGRKQSAPPLFKPSFVSTLYLAPHNYHRVHSPISGELISLWHIPGTLWPVNPKFLDKVPRLFAKNERLVFEIRTKEGGTLYLVMVGALNVGRIKTPFWKELTTNDELLSPRAKKKNQPSQTHIKEGEELGTFLMGSTVILVFDQKAHKNLPHKPKVFPSKQAVKMGENLLG